MSLCDKLCRYLAYLLLLIFIKTVPCILKKHQDHVMSSTNPEKNTFLIVIIFYYIMYDCWITVNRFLNCDSVISSQFDSSGSQACLLFPVNHSLCLILICSLSGSMFFFDCIMNTFVKTDVEWWISLFIMNKIIRF